MMGLPIVGVCTRPVWHHNTLLKGALACGQLPSASSACLGVAEARGDAHGARCMGLGLYPVRCTAAAAARHGPRLKGRPRVRSRARFGFWGCHSLPPSFRRITPHTDTPPAHTWVFVLHNDPAGGGGQLRQSKKIPYIPPILRDETILQYTGVGMGAQPGKSKF